jgi:hypothetical protein
MATSETIPGGKPPPRSRAGKPGSRQTGYSKARPTAEDGIVRSRVFPGLWIDCAALIRSDAATALLVLQKGIASDEHREFIKSD